MKPLLCSLLLLLTFSLSAQAPEAVPLAREPHHHLVFENDYVRVFRVSVPAHAATLLHQHDVPYVYVSLGPADVVNAVQGRPEARIVMADGQVGYSPGHFAHIARTDAGSTFDNVTIELLKPQMFPRNVCAPVISSGFAACDPMAKGRYVMETQFATTEMDVNLAWLVPKAKHEEITKLPVLVIGTGDCQIKLSIKDKPPKMLREGEVAWFDAGSRVRFSNEGAKIGRYFELKFKDAIN
jgi:hypothetical protein